MTRSVFDVLKKSQANSLKKKRTSGKHVTSGNEERHRLNNRKSTDDTSLVGLLVVGDPPGANCQSEAKSSVFSVLTANAAKVFQTHYFFCGLDHGDSWQTDMWTAGQTPPAHTAAPKWSATVKVKLRTPELHTVAQAAPLQEVEIKLCTNVACDAKQAHTTEGGRLKAALEQNTPPPGYERYIGGAPLLKSALQKSIRRCRPKEAAKLAFALLELSASDALRRAAVMSLEDACLHPLLPAVVWLMMAQAKGYQLNFDHKAMVIRYFYELACSPVRESSDFETPTQKSRQEATHGSTGLEGGRKHVAAAQEVQSPSVEDCGLQAINTAVRCPSERALVSSMLLRASYGGMVCDVALLQGACGCWLNRIQTCQNQQGLAAAYPLTARECSTNSLSVTPRDDVHPQSVEVCGVGTVGEADLSCSRDGKPQASPWQGIHMLRASDIPLAAVDSHVTQGVMSALLDDDAVLSGAEELSCGQEFSGDDPQQILYQLMYADPQKTSPTLLEMNTALWTCRSGVSFKRPVSFYHPKCAEAIAQVAQKQEDKSLGVLERRMCSVADSWARKYIIRCFSRS